MIIYYRGDLPRDRRINPELDQLARDYLVAGTERNMRVYHVDNPDKTRGTGLGFLTQKRICEGMYEYRFTPARS